MTSKCRISTNLTPFSRRLDRFVSDGYTDEMALENAIKDAGKIQSLDGLEFLYPPQFAEAGKVKDLMSEAGLVTSCVQVDVFIDRIWKFGSLASSDADIRKRAVELSQRCMDISAELGAHRILLWLGHDGYDYVFQTNYRSAWDNLTNSLAAIAEYRSDVQVSLEYKIREPRTHSHLGNMGTALIAIKEANQPNLGVVIDTGHSLMAYENLAEVATIALRQDALHGFHLNDCFRYADDDLVMGTVHTWEFVELFYWMLIENFSGWWTLDTYPYRENGIKVIEESIDMFNALMDIARKLELEKISPLQLKSDALTVFEYLRSTGLNTSTSPQ